MDGIKFISYYSHVPKNTKIHYASHERFAIFDYPTMRLFLMAALALTALTLSAQPKQNSPYSRYGLGDPITRYFAAQSGMAGQTAAFHDPFHLNIGNPASYAFLRATALETGMYAKYSQYQASNSSQNVWSGNLAYLALGFTLKSPINEVMDKDVRKWKFGMGVSLTPYSQVGYRIQSRDTLPELGIVQSDFEGTGGAYRLAWQGAARYKQTAVGATLGWQFGNSLYENTTIFVDSLPTYQNNSRDQFSAKGFVWNLGVQHDFVLQTAENDKNTPTRWVTVGATGEARHNLRAVADIVRFRSRGKNPSTQQYIDADTLVYLPGADRTLTLPSTFSLGVQYVKADKMKIGAQVTLENWANYKNEVRPEVLRNTFGVSVGGEWIPEYNSYNKFMRRFRYRYGAYYRQDPRSVQGQNLDDIGISLGLGMPLILPRQQASFINFAVEAGRFGASSPIEETYIRMTLGFTLNDNTWFFKRRFE
jgi:hypothetical protein